MRWLTENIATAAYNEAIEHAFPSGTVIVDVRDLVDKAGNSQAQIRERVASVLKLLRAGNSVVICCDYGMSRSNAIAIGAIAQWKGIPFSEAIAAATAKVDAAGIKIEVLAAVEAATAGASPTNERGQNILVTGSSGFIGRTFFKTYRDSDRYIPAFRNDFDLMEGNLKLDQYVKSNGIGGILHLANPQVFTTNQSMGDTLVMLKNVLDVCRSNNLRITYLSGWEVYSGYCCDSLLAPSDLPLNPKGTYGETKWLSELLIKKYVGNYGIKHQVLRLPPLYGTVASKPRFIFNFIEKAQSGSAISTHRYINGPPKLGLLHVDDAVQLIHRLSQSDFSGEINAGASELVSSYDVAVMIRELLGSSSRIDQTMIDSFWPNISLDVSEPKKLFDWAPQISVKLGLQRLVEEFKANQ